MSNCSLGGIEGTSDDYHESNSDDPLPVGGWRRMVSGIASYLSVCPRGKDAIGSSCLYRKSLGIVGIVEFHSHQ